MQGVTKVIWNRCLECKHYLQAATTYRLRVHYRSFLLKYIIAKIDESDSASEVVKLNILVAIRWVAQKYPLMWLYSGPS